MLPNSYEYINLHQQDLIRDAQQIAFARQAQAGTQRTGWLSAGSELLVAIGSVVNRKPKAMNVRAELVTDTHAQVCATC